jgi:hypothetical protein
MLFGSQFSPSSSLRVGYDVEGNRDQPGWRNWQTQRT